MNNGAADVSCTVDLDNNHQLFKVTLDRSLNTVFGVRPPISADVTDATRRPFTREYRR